MTETFCQLAPKYDAGSEFIQAVTSKNDVRLRELLSLNIRLQQDIDQPWFAFDSPAIVTSKQCRAVLEVLREFGADINARSDWWAGSFGVLDGVDLQTAEFLIKRGAKLDIHSAAALGKAEFVSDMIQTNPECVNQRGGDGQTPLHFAKLELVDLLLENGADLNIKCLDHSATAAQYAVTEPLKCHKLLQAGATVDIFMAAALGDRRLVDQVLDSEPDALATRVGFCRHTSPVHPRSDRHIYFWKLRSAESPLDVARIFQNADFYQELFDRSPAKHRFLAACWDAKPELANSILQSTANLFYQLDPHECQALARAAWHGNLPAVKTMLQFGFDPHLPGDERSTPLDRAAFHGHHEIVSWLLENDSQPPLEFQNVYGGTPLSCCAYGSLHSWKKNTNHLATARLLIAAGSVIDPSWLPLDNPQLDQLFRDHL